MGCLTVNIFERADEMKFGKVSFPGNILQVYLTRIVCINEKLCLHNPSVKVFSGMVIPFHNLLIALPSIFFRGKGLPLAA